MAWKSWHEQWAARMRARAAKELLNSGELSEPITNGNDLRATPGKRDRRAEWKAKSEEKKKKQLEGLKEALKVRMDNAKKKRDSVPKRVVVTRGPQKSRGTAVGTKRNQWEYPPCPQCQEQERIVRAGTGQDGFQRYRCRACRRSFGGRDSASPLFIVRVQDPFHVTCFRCGGNGEYKRQVYRKYRATAEGGIRAYCPHCQKNFTQGGPQHLEHTLSVLLERVEQAHSHKAVQEELLQEAVAEVLQGNGYTWNIPLNVTAAKKAAFGASFETAEYRRNEKNEPKKDLG